MPFSIDHYPTLPLPLLAIAQSEMPPPLWSLLCSRCSWELKRLRSATFVRLLCFDLWNAHAVPSYWQIWVAVNGKSDLARSYCWRGGLWTCSVSMAAGVFAVDELPHCNSVQFYDLTNTDDLLKALSLPIILLCLLFPSPCAPHSLFFTGSLPCINIVPL